VSVIRFPVERTGPLPPRPFDAAGPLPTGTVVLEASAGTGKTWTVAALVTRYVAEGVARLDELLVITFGRAASQELRERVRERLVRVERALGDPAADRDDPVVAVLVDAPPAEVALRRARLTAALTDFDAATIATTHQFCQQVLTGLGVAGDTDTGTVLVEDLDDLLVDVVDDVYLRSFGGDDARTPRFDRALALKIARAAVNDPQSQLEPRDVDTVSTPFWRYRFATTVREELERRKRRRLELGYDDLLSRLAAALAPEDSPARDRMRERWRVVLVDEFQDTDHVQWEVLRLAFEHFATLVLIGDPKQAIYAFRGGDIATYLGAVRTATDIATLGRNWRSDADLTEALDLLLGGTALGDDDIRVRPVQSEHLGRRLRGAPSTAPVRVRQVRRDQFPAVSSVVPVAPVRKYVADDLAGDVVRLLASGATFGPPGAERPLTAGDLAVLVSTHAQGDLVQDALGRAGVPRVVSGGGNVYRSDAARAWFTLLSALDAPHRSGWVRAAAVTPFFGLSADELAAGGDALTDGLADRLRDWAEIARHSGIAGMLEVITHQDRLWPRVLGRPLGERLLTDLRQIGEGLQKASTATEGGMGLPALREWLLIRRDAASAPTNDERARRLDSDAAAVQIVTLHASKGLEYPVVYLPFAFDRYVSQRVEMPLLHDENGRRLRDVGGDEAPGHAGRAAQALREEAGESLRLLYVGLTRAQSQVVTWWAPTANTRAAAWHRVLFGRRQDGAVPDSVPVPSDAVARDRLQEWQERGALSAEVAEPQQQALRMTPAEVPLRPEIGVFAREIDLGWRRTSYSALTAPSGTGPDVATSEPEIDQRDDENDDPVPDLDGPTAADAAAPETAGPDAAARAVPSPMRELPAGAAFGTVVHAVLEELDPAADDLEAGLREIAARQITLAGLAVAPDQLVGGLLPSLRTPLGPLAGDRCLLDFGLRDRLSELTFELPLAGGDRPVADRLLADLVPVLRRHLATDPLLAGYPDRLLDPDLARRPLRGYLTGSIDAVLRTPENRFLVVDYKTNRLGGADTDPAALTAWDYRPAAMAAEMIHSHYPLQALLYQVALHRFLRWRLPGYAPDEHLGGVLYLFLRGMCGPATPVPGSAPCGVFDWTPPVALVLELSAVLDGGR
jgi:exodeoxyribonuclease V beta subunit